MSEDQVILPTRAPSVETLWAALVLLAALGVLVRFFKVLPWVAVVAAIIGVSLLALGRRFDLDAGRPALLVATGLVAAWFAARPPWGDIASAVLWAGAVLIVTGIVAGRGTEQGGRSAAVLFALGLVGGILSGWAAAQLGVPNTLAVVVVVVAGRFAAWSLMDRPEALWAAPLALAAIAYPGLLGTWGLAAAAVEGATLYGAARVDRTASAWPFALGGIGVVAGFYVAATGLGL